MRSLFSKAIMLLLLVLVAYNIWQVSVMRQEISALKQEIETLEAANRASNSLLHDINKHINEAKKHILHRDLKSAREELDEGLKIVTDISQSAEQQYSDAMDKAQNKYINLKGILEHLWQKVSNKSDEEQGG